MGAVFTRGIDLIEMDRKAKHKRIRMMDSDFIEKMSCRAYTLKESTHFIDIGVPESYNKAQDYIPDIFG